MQQADILLSVAMRPGLTMADLTKMTGLSHASVSRNIAALSEYHRLGKPGLNLIEAVTDPRETRRRLIYLTTKGKELLTKMARQIEGTFSMGADIDARLDIERMHEEAMAAAPEGNTRGKINPKK
ncbi:MarR family transcriptional regulator [Devosia neptuniae]|uniref:MarR family transcriptional regulator n=1 Tax=Devosia neptuniae TaxID=191302 RepID=A0ABY6CBI6_9HYPH|nr:MarR family transcriptional regulator [Devosia neptuniae]UXN69609.1 MarR family transcriptional regulator [Devosia neptuniae]